MVKSTKMLNKHFGSSYLFLYQSVFPVQLFSPLYSCYIYRTVKAVRTVPQPNKGDLKTSLFFVIKVKLFLLTEQVFLCVCVCVTAIPEV